MIENDSESLNKMIHTLLSSHYFNLSKPLMTLLNITIVLSNYIQLYQLGSITYPNRTANMLKLMDMYKLQLCTFKPVPGISRYKHVVIYFQEIIIYSRGPIYLFTSFTSYGNYLIIKYLFLSISYIVLTSYY